MVCCRVVLYNYRQVIYYYENMSTAPTPRPETYAEFIEYYGRAEGSRLPQDCLIHFLGSRLTVCVGCPGLLEPTLGTVASLAPGNATVSNITTIYSCRGIGEHGEPSKSPECPRITVLDAAVKSADGLYSAPGKKTV